MTLGRITLVAATVAVLALTAAASVAADPSTASLAGEEMLVQDVTLTTLDCDPTQVSTIGYAASGVATGPYPGTFTVQGTVTIEPQTQPGPRPGTVAGPLASLSETFTIVSALGNVTGTKSLPLRPRRGRHRLVPARHRLRHRPGHERERNGRRRLQPARLHGDDPRPVRHDQRHRRRVALVHRAEPAGHVRARLVRLPPGRLRPVLPHFDAGGVRRRHERPGERRSRLPGRGRALVN